MDSPIQNSLKSADSDYMLQKKFEIMMDLHSKRILNEIKNLAAMIAKTNEEINYIKGIISEKPKKESIPEKKIDFVPREINRDNEPKPRSGDYESKDVAIDKFFYCGTKR